MRHLSDWVVWVFLFIVVQLLPSSRIFNLHSDTRLLTFSLEYRTWTEATAPNDCKVSWEERRGGEAGRTGRGQLASNGKEGGNFW